MMANRYYETYKENTREFKKKHTKKERSFEEQFLLVYWCGMIGAGFIHLCSFVSAVAYPTHEFQVMFGNFYLGMIISGVLVFVFIEIPKYTFFTVFFENKFDTGTQSYFMLSIAIGLALFSAYLSPNGTEYLVEWFAGDAKIEDTQVRQDDYKEQRASIVGLWQPKIEQLRKEYNTWYESQKRYYAKEKDPKTGKLGRYRLPNARSLRNKDKGYTFQIAEMEKSLNQELRELSALKTTVVTDLVAKNKEKEKEHEEKKEHASIFSFFLMLILEGIYILSLAGMKYYQHRSIEEKPKGQKKEQTKTELEQETTGFEPIAIKTEPEQPEQGESSSDKGGETKQPSMQIPYQNSESEQKEDNEEDIFHGKVFKNKGQRTARVWFEKEDGLFVAYTPGAIMSQIKSKEGSDNRKKELLELYNKVVNYKG